DDGPADDARSGGEGERAGDLSVRRGRVAYLRCDGVEHAGGPFPCPRDEALEAAVWSIVDGLAACAGAPSAPGRGDVRLDYRGDAAPAIDWRDTFADDVVRLDAARVLGCLREELAGTRQSLGARRLLVSFRFALE
ncbi:MAG TPA: hypothetical protein RMH99_11015, partial [Sandaracinaceae bacterium LLY-WYZ-13_1]|nr:hypothetical protein [Sandaracinaceae bacterium LLY-WYZ-13_1]